MALKRQTRATTAYQPQPLQRCRQCGLLDIDCQCNDIHRVRGLTAVGNCGMCGHVMTCYGCVQRGLCVDCGGL